MVKVHVSVTFFLLRESNYQNVCLWERIDLTLFFLFYFLKYRHPHFHRAKLECMSERGETSQPKLRHSSLLAVLDNAVVVPNEGSMARDQCANERTYLSWLKLSCTIVVLGKEKTTTPLTHCSMRLITYPFFHISFYRTTGFTIIINLRLPNGEKQPSIDPRYTRPIGITFVAIGMLAFILGLIKYFRNVRLLILHRTLVQAGWVSFLLMAIVSLFACTIMLIVVSSDTL
jgi:uncharacterized membrane protein YidH (DUF202 family)